MCGDVNENQKHPHVRGEDTIRAASLYLRRETPPRAWGRLYTLLLQSFLRRNTPTCVGKTRPFVRIHSSGEKHPHVRGEDNLRKNVRQRNGETPPHAWGRRKPPLEISPLLRNTPTCVGKTHSLPNSLIMKWKHPHMRGEDSFMAGDMLCALETPPHAWGRH